MRFTPLGASFLVSFFIGITQWISEYLDYENSLAIYFGFISFYSFADLFFIKVAKIVLSETTIYEILAHGLIIFITFLNFNNLIHTIYLNTTNNSKILFLCFAVIGLIIPILKLIITLHRQRQNRNRQLAEQQQQQQPLVAQA